MVVALAGVFGVVDFFAFGEDAEVEEEEAKRLDMPPRRLPVMLTRHICTSACLSPFSSARKAKMGTVSSKPI